jgi:RimJ/RimL family protein N-acetyltransferase
MADVELRPIAMTDLPLYAGMLTDPRMMTELGGPVPLEGLADKLAGIVASVERDEDWFFVIVADDEDVGTVCVWMSDDEWGNAPEIGWMVRPEHQGKGLGSAAVAAVLRLAREQDRWGEIHAHPGVSNGPSNAICRKNGFEQLGERDVRFRDRTLRCNHWRVDVRDDRVPAEV